MPNPKSRHSSTPRQGRDHDSLQAAQTVLQNCQEPRSSIASSEFGFYKGLKVIHIDQTPRPRLSRNIPDY